MRTRQGTKKRILDAAGELFQRNGFSGFSYQHIASQLGVKNAAIHYHYPSKTDLGVALIRRYRANFSWWTDQLASQGVDPVARLEAFFDLEERYLREGKVCPLGGVGVEHAGIPEPMRRETEVFVGELLGWLTRALDDGARDGVLTFSGTASGKALSLLTSLQGGLQVARVGGSGAFQRIVEQVRTELGLPRERTARRMPAAV
ncbi:TetR/AcrR family transcriptional regulator [Aquisalimonas asiatica]|uniref:Transcriptional regulator, TetR family n=1 Tax=Aquisalimonas asiatica TaxID=406100 RepID=A0A1H8TML2_9GAMM|nr:TetR/AcrR family transcriptional regulator [Aquisalimonas asiatica]SEO92081.1 transcriptional regulator, TetR family [Aquisalimonas asiatica]